MLRVSFADNVLTIADDTVTGETVRRREVYHLAFAHMTADGAVAKIEAVDYPLHHPHLNHEDKANIDSFFKSCVANVNNS